MKKTRIKKHDQILIKEGTMLEQVVVVTRIIGRNHVSIRKLNGIHSIVVSLSFFSVPNTVITPPLVKHYNPVLD